MTDDMKPDEVCGACDGTGMAIIQRAYGYQIGPPCFTCHGTGRGEPAKGSEQPLSGGARGATTQTASPSPAQPHEVADGPCESHDGLCTRCGGSGTEPAYAK